MGGDRAVHAQEPARRAPPGRPPHHLRHFSRLEDGLPLAGLPFRIRSAHDGLQSLQPLVAQAVLDRNARGAGQGRRSHQLRRHRFHLHQSPTLGVRWKRGAKTQKIGPSRGGNTTKIHALTDVIGRPFRLLLTPGNVHDLAAAPELLAELEGAQYLLGDKGYDADNLRALVRKQGARPVIPGKANRKRKIPLDKARYRSRHLVENAFCRLKDFRRVATRYDKLARNFLSAVALAVLLAFWI